MKKHERETMERIKAAKARKKAAAEAANAPAAAANETAAAVANIAGQPLKREIVQHVLYM